MNKGKIIKFAFTHFSRVSGMVKKGIRMISSRIAAFIVGTISLVLFSISLYKILANLCTFDKCHDFSSLYTPLPRMSMCFYKIFKKYAEKMYTMKLFNPLTFQTTSPRWIKYLYYCISRFQYLQKIYQNFSKDPKNYLSKMCEIL